jgi:serine/threonine protein kinase
MAVADLTRLILMLDAARTPEDVFGPLVGPRTAQAARVTKVYRQLAKVVHPDTIPDAADRARAAAAFRRLNEWRAAATAWIENPSHGGHDHRAHDATAVHIRTRGRAYTIGSPLAGGDLCQVYRGRRDDGAAVVFKVARDPADNDLVENEATILRALAADPRVAPYRPYFPALIDAFDYGDATTTGVRRTNVLPHLEGFLSLREVRTRFPAGLPVEHMGWIWRRLLTALAATHRTGIVHGAVLPDHVLIHPTQRGLVLIDWSYALRDPARDDSHIPAISTAYTAWYPVEVWQKRPPTPATDLFLAARCMMDLLGGDPLSGVMPASVPASISRFLRGTALPRPHQRPRDAAALLGEFDDLLTRLFGARRYLPLVMPDGGRHASR